MLLRSKFIELAHAAAPPHGVRRRGGHAGDFAANDDSDATITRPDSRAATIHQDGRRASRSAASVPPSVMAVLAAQSERVSRVMSSTRHEAIDLLTRNPGLLRLSAASRQASVGAAAQGHSRIRMESLSTRLMALETFFDMQAYGLGISNAQRRPGGVTIAFEFYSKLFAAQKQLGTKLTKVTTQLAERADGTMSYGELTFLLKDFKILPQLVSRGELLHILSQRTLGKQLRRRREQYDLSLSLLAQEEEALDRDRKAAQLVPMGFKSGAAASGLTPPDRRIHSLSADKLRPGEGSGDEILDRIARRAERVRQLRGAVSRFESSMVDASTQVEARMEHGTYELSFTEFLEVLVRIALFAFSKPALLHSSIGRASLTAVTQAADLPRATALVASNASMMNLAVTSGTETGAAGPLDSAFAQGVRGVAGRLALHGYTDIAETPEFKVMRLLRYAGLDVPAVVKRVVLTIGAATQQYLNATPGMTDPTRKAFAGRRNAELMARTAGETEVSVTPAAAARPVEEDVDAQVHDIIEAAASVGGDTQGAGIGRRASLKAMLFAEPAAILGPKPVNVAQLTLMDESAVSETHAAVEHHHNTRVGQWVKDAHNAWIDTRYSMRVRGRDTVQGEASSASSAGLLPEDALLTQYNNSLCDLVRRFEYDTVSPVFKSFGSAFIDCGTLAYAHRVAAVAAGAPDEQQQTFRYRLCITNECTDVLAITVSPHALPSHIFSLHVVETRSSVTITTAAASGAKRPQPRGAAARPSPLMHSASLPGFSATLQRSSSGAFSPGGTAASPQPLLLSTGTLGRGPRDFDDVDAGDGAPSPSRVAAHVADMSMMSAHAAAGLLGSTANVTGLTRWSKRGMSARVDPHSHAITVRDLAPGLSLVIELVVVPPAAPVDADAHAQLVDGVHVDAIPIMTERTHEQASAAGVGLSGEVLGSLSVEGTSVSGELQSVSVPVYAKFEYDIERAVAPAIDEDGDLLSMDAPVSHGHAAPVHADDPTSAPPPVRVSSSGLGVDDVVSPRRSGAVSSVTGSPMSRVRAPLIKRGESFTDLASGSRKPSAVDSEMDIGTARLRQDSFISSTSRMFRAGSFTTELGHTGIPEAHEVDEHADEPVSVPPRSAGVTSSLSRMARLGRPPPRRTRTPATITFDAGLQQLNTYLAHALGDSGRAPAPALVHTAAVTRLGMSSSTGDLQAVPQLKTIASELGTSMASLSQRAARHAASTVKAAPQLSIVQRFRMPQTSAHME